MSSMSERISHIRASKKLTVSEKNIAALSEMEAISWHQPKTMVESDGAARIVSRMRLKGEEMAITTQNNIGEENRVVTFDNEVVEKVEACIDPAPSKDKEYSPGIHGTSLDEEEKVEEK